MDANARKPQLLSVVVAAYHEAENLPVLYERLVAVLQAHALNWEWVIVDDHSADSTFQVIAKLAKEDERIRGYRLSRNSGSHIAIVCGLEHARGDVAIVIAADLQDPPEEIPNLLRAWEKGAQVVWAVRERREGETATTVGLANSYYWLMRRVVGIKEMPATGADFMLLDRVIIDALAQTHERNASILALITWLGFRQTQITYVRRARLHGKSGWNLGKRIKLALDSIISFTYLPIRVMSGLGFIVALLGFGYAAIVIINALAGKPTEGWSSLMVVVLILGGIQMLMMGVLGEYLWRTFDEARQHPRYWIEAIVANQTNTNQKLNV